MSGRITIGHLLYSFGRGGTENVLVKIINSMDPDRFRHVIVTTHDDHALRAHVSTDRTLVHTLNGRSLPGKISEVFRIIKRERIDVLHARGWSLMLEGGILGNIARIPSIYSFHGKTHDELARSSKKRLLIEMLSSRMYDVIVTLTPAMKKDLVDSWKLDAGKVQVISNGIHEVPVSDEIRLKARNAWGIREHEFVVGFAGRFDPVKDLDTLVEAFHGFVTKHCDARLVLIGDGVCNDPIRELVSRKGIEEKVVFAGFSDRVQEQMQAFDVYVQTSLYEGLSNTILEAVSVGLPVVCTDVGGNGDIIHHGENGFLVGAREIEEFEKYMDIIYVQPELRRIMSEKNVKLHRTTYLLAGMIEKYERMYSNSCRLYE